MAEIVNLRRHRRTLLKAAHDQAAAENRARHGRTKAERDRDRLAEERRRALLDGAQREDEDRS